MQLKKFTITSLFNEFDHSIEFPTRPEDSLDPSVTLLCGPNGIGKTRILKMIEGFMELDFDSFREVPFKLASLQFSDKSMLSVKYVNRIREKKKHRCLRVKFKDEHVDLALKGTGPLFGDETYGNRKTHSWTRNMLRVEVLGVGCGCHEKTIPPPLC